MHARFSKLLATLAASAALAAPLASFAASASQSGAIGRPDVRGAIADRIGARCGNAHGDGRAPREVISSVRASLD